MIIHFIIASMEPDKKIKIRELRAWVTFRLKLKGLTIGDLSKKYNCDLPTVFFRPFPKAEKIIADALDLLPQELWPWRYDENGKPNRRRGRRKNITKNTEVKENLNGPTWQK
jgi:Ner family transcriptional regulator